MCGARRSHSTRTIRRAPTVIVTPAMLADKEVVKQLTIEQKIEFWRRVMQYAKDRNIEFYVDDVEHLHLRRRWQVRHHRRASTTRRPSTTSAPACARCSAPIHCCAASGSPPARTWAMRAATFGGTDSFDAKENWLFATYGQGVLDAARAEPQRQFRLIHRQHETRAQDIATTFKPVIAQPNVDFVFSFKYAQAHALVVHHADLPPRLSRVARRSRRRSGRCAMTTRCMYRWAAPDFVREFVKNIPYEKSQGYYSAPTCGCGAASSWRADPRLAAAARDRQALAALPAVGTARLRPHARQRAHRGARRAALPGIDGRRFSVAVAGRVDDLSTGHGLSLGGLRLPVVHRRLPQPAEPGENRQRLSQRGDLHQPAGSSGHVATSRFRPTSPA